MKKYFMMQCDDLVYTVSTKKETLVKKKNPREKYIFYITPCKYAPLTTDIII